MKTKELFAVCLATAAVGTSFPLEAEPVIDDTPTRVQTDLDVPYACIGTLRPKTVGELSASRWTVDCAGYERDHIDWRNVRDNQSGAFPPADRLEFRRRNGESCIERASVKGGVDGSCDDPYQAVGRKVDLVAQPPGSPGIFVRTTEADGGDPATDQLVCRLTGSLSSGRATSHRFL